MNSTRATFSPSIAISGIIAGAATIPSTCWSRWIEPMAFGRKASKPRAFLNEAGLHEYAVRTLGRAMRTEAELRRLMKTRVEPGPHGEATVEAVIGRLKEYGYLDDKSFAE